jgi:ABC-type transport system involved in Fe-S cluster assembly fused permease/ATPase subunit
MASTSSRSTIAILRRKIGFVLQENHLFDDTIARNIAFGEEEPDLDAVMWAAQVANAREFVEQLPFGYDTRIGESGLASLGRAAAAHRDRTRHLQPPARARLRLRPPAPSTPSPSVP